MPGYHFEAELEAEEEARLRAEIRVRRGEGEPPTFVGGGAGVHPHLKSDFHSTTSLTSRAFHVGDALLACPGMSGT